MGDRALISYNANIASMSAGDTRNGTADRNLRLTTPKIIVVTPVYNEQEALPRYVERINSVLMQDHDARYEVLFVDDGSTDASWHVLEDLCRKDERFRAIRLSRNFGAHVALTAGIDHAEGDAVVTLACDLQDPPEVVPEFVVRWKRGAQVVWGVRRSRTDSWLRSRISALFTLLLRRFALPAGSQFATGSFLLLDRVVVECFRKFREHNRITFALVAWSGFDQDSVFYDRTERVAGSSSWNASRLWKVGYDALIGFSAMPARLMTLTGVFTFFASLIATVYLVGSYFFSDVLPGWTGLMVTMTFFFGVLFIMVGMVAEYLHRIFVESTQRPLYFVSRKVGADIRK